MDHALHSMTPTPAAAILAGIRAKDRDVFTRFVADNDRDMIRLAYVISGDPDVARDAVQEAWRRLWTHPPDLRDETRVREWVRSVVANEARQTFRRAGAQDRAARRLPMAASSGDPAERVDLMDVTAAIQTLTDDERELIALRFVLGLSSAEISDQLGASEEAVRTRLHRALGRVRKEVLR